MANLYWAGPKAKREEISAHLMKEAAKHLPAGTYATRFEDGEAQLWIEVEDAHDNSICHWYIFDSRPKIMGWRLLLFKCPSGFIGSGIKKYYAYEEISDVS